MKCPKALKNEKYLNIIVIISIYSACVFGALSLFVFFTGNGSEKMIVGLIYLTISFIIYLYAIFLEHSFCIYSKLIDIEKGQKGNNKTPDSE